MIFGASWELGGRATDATAAYLAGCVAAAARALAWRATAGTGLALSANGSLANRQLHKDDPTLGNFGSHFESMLAWGDAGRTLSGYRRKNMILHLSSLHPPSNAHLERRCTRCHDRIQISARCVPSLSRWWWCCSSSNTQWPCSSRCEPAAGCWQRAGWRGPGNAARLGAGGRCPHHRRQRPRDSSRAPATPPTCRWWSRAVSTCGRPLSP
jgi:hypothetical protein